MALINKLSAIGEAIREKTGKEDLLTLDEMPAEIKGIESGDSWYDTFWDGFQESGNRTNYNNGFYGASWTEEIFKPKYTIKPTAANAIFHLCPIKNLKEVLENAGVALDTSRCSDMRSLIQNSSITHLPCISFEKATSASYTSNTFYSGQELLYIEKLIVIKENVWGANTFGGCKKLTTIAEIEGEIATNFNVSVCSNLDSLTVNNIINALADMTGETAKTLTLHADVKARLTQDQIAQITNKNWTLA